MDLVTDISHSQPSTAAVTSSSSLLKRYEDVIANDQGTSFAPTLLIRKKTDFTVPRSSKITRSKMFFI
jgi:hypothetical protein